MFLTFTILRIEKNAFEYIILILWVFKSNFTIIWASLFEQESRFLYNFLSGYVWEEEVKEVSSSVVSR